MKKTILITTGILILLIIVGVWLYLFMYGTPKNADEVFARFGIGGDKEIIPVAPEETRIDVATSTGTGAPKRLRQLTTRPVAGAAFDLDGIRYVEQGTGHIYHINLTTGEETLISGTTIPQTTRALFSKDASQAAITSHESSGNTTLVGELVTSSIEAGGVKGVLLPTNAREIAFGQATDTIVYLLDDKSGSAAYEYNIVARESKRVFSIPLRDVHVLWGESPYVYTTPTAIQKGFLYKVSKNKLVYLTPGGAGLMGVLYDDGIIVTKTSKKNLISTAISYDGTEQMQALPFIPEKCTINPKQEKGLYCTVPSNRADELFPDDWYKGILSYSDTLWSMDITTGAATPLSDFKSESGREIDVIQIGTNIEGTYLWFVNKNDNTLWMFDTTL